MHEIVLSILAAAGGDPIVIALISGGVVGAVVSLIRWRTEKVGVEATASKIATETAVAIIGELRTDNAALRQRLSELTTKHESCDARIDELQEQADHDQRRIIALEHLLREHGVNLND